MVGGRWEPVGGRWYVAGAAGTQGVRVLGEPPARSLMEREGGKSPCPSCSARGQGARRDQPWEESREVKGGEHIRTLFGPLVDLPRSAAFTCVV